MVGIGGVTRLTNSGLSIVDWKPIFGIIPPLSDADWIEEFNHYKKYPEYKKINNKIDLSSFKKIYFWEYLHRILGRVIGLYFLLPFLYLILKKQIDKQKFFKIGGIILLVVAQGLLGWYMVKSGLTKSPHISHFRLMLHFLAAMLLLLYCYYLYLQSKSRNSYVVTMSRGSLYLTSALIFFQIIYGTFTAGLNAGYAYNTFPYMDGSIFPYNFFSGNTLFYNLFINPYAIQFIHRMLGSVLFCFSLYIIFIEFKNNRLTITNSLELQFGLLIFMQFFLGVFTLILSVPLALAVFHQVNTCFILLKCTDLYYYSKD